MQKHYYKALDMKSNSIRIREKKRLVNKNILLELEKNEQHVDPKRGVRIVETIPRFLGLRNEFHFYRP